MRETGVIGPFGVLAWKHAHLAPEWAPFCRFGNQHIKLLHVSGRHGASLLLILMPQKDLTLGFNRLAMTRIPINSKTVRMRTTARLERVFAIWYLFHETTERGVFAISLPCFEGFL